MSKVRMDGTIRAEAIDPARYAIAEVDYTAYERFVIVEMEAAISERLAKKPRRLAHSRSVAATAEALAVRYGVNPWEARVAGILHDWDKALSLTEQLAKARELDVGLEEPLELVAPLLHGITAAHELAMRYPALPPGVLQAISRHTIGAVDMSPLDMVVFTADIIEPQRPAVPAVEATRALVVDDEPLTTVYWSAFVRGIAYVIESGRYLYPGTIDIYNQVVLAQDGGPHRKRKDRHARDRA